MKLAIVTFYDAFNYGCFLQAYAMQKTLEQLGHQVTILNCRKNIIKTINKVITLNPFRQKTKLQRYAAYRKAWRELNIQPHKGQAFDAVIIGSDEVWNIQNPGAEKCPEYFGHKLTAGKIIAYAPSCGYATLQDILKKPVAVAGIKQLDAVFPRDDNTKAIAQQIRGEACPKVLDPTLLHLEHWDKETMPIQRELGDYLFYYSYNAKPPMLGHIQQFARENELKTVVAGFDYKWCDEKLIVHPRQFLTLMKNAKYVVTNTFHGSIFAVVFKKQFIGAYPNKNPKTNDFLASVGLQNRVYTPNMAYDQFANILQTRVDYQTVHDRIKQSAQESLNYLQNQLPKQD